MKKIALVNQKGGCGKTTTAINLSSCLANLDKKVLLLDLDPQGHAALGLGVDTEEMEASIYEVLSGDVPISRAICQIKDNIYTVSGNGDIIESDDKVAAIGSGGPYALAAGRALTQNTDLSAKEICRRSLELAGEICIYTNKHITLLTLDDAPVGEGPAS